MADQIRDLISSERVEGTTVYGIDREKVGSVESVMIDKASGQVAYAVLSFGGFLGIGDEQFPLPWQSLKYDIELGGYLTNVTKEQLQGAPKYSNEGDWDWTDTQRSRKVDDYYGTAFV